MKLQAPFAVHIDVAQVRPRSLNAKRLFFVIPCPAHNTASET